MNIKNVCLGLAIALTACAGGPAEYPEAEPEIGTVQQAIHLPVRFGFEQNGMERCSPPWTGGRCWVPDNSGGLVHLRYNIIESSCTKYGGFMKDRIRESLQALERRVEGAGGVLVSEVESGDAVNVRCGHVSGWNHPYKVELVASDEHYTHWGILTQFYKGTITIDEDEIYNYFGFRFGTLDNQVNISRNATAQALYVAAGIGYDIPGTGGLMDPYFPDDYSYAEYGVWKWVLNPKSSDIKALDCYNPASGDEDRCWD